MHGRSNLLSIAIPLVIIVLGVAVYQYGYLRVQLRMTEMEEAASLKMKTLKKQMTLIADRPTIEKNLAALKEARRMENVKLVEGQTAPLAAATLQNTVKDAITSRGGSIASERVEKPENAGDFKIVTVTIDAILPDTRALGDTLLAIETQTPYLVVRELDTRIRNFRDPRDLTIKLKVSGLTGGR